MGKIPDFTNERVADRLEIQHRIVSFARGVDRLDLELAMSAFHPDATDDHGAYKGSSEGLIKWIMKRHETIELSFHHMGNIFIEFAGPNDAMCESYCLTWQSVTPEANVLPSKDSEDSNAPADKYELLACNRYVDHFTRRDGAWRIQKRTTVVESFMRVPGVPTKPGPEWAAPRRDSGDPSMLLRKELGIG